MNINTVESLACTLSKDYHENFRKLKDDIEFFRLYMQHEAQSSSFVFDVKVSMGRSDAFDAIWRSYGRGNESLREVYALHEVLRAMIIDVYEENNRFSAKTKMDFFKFFERHTELDVLDFVGGFIDCSLGASGTKERIRKIREY